MSTAGRVAELFAPDPVVVRAGPVDPAAIEQLPAELTPHIESMSAARAAEFATARLFAHQTLTELGIDSPIVRRDRRQPIWPRGTTGSITHNHGWCVCVAARKGKLEAVGIDCERPDRLNERVARRILTGRESRELPRTTGTERQLDLARTFAAKEAFYKAFFQIERRYIGFDAVSVTRTRQPGDRNQSHQHEQFELAFVPEVDSVGPELAARTRGRWLTEGERVVVAVAIDA